MMRALFKLALRITRIRGLNRLDRPLRNLARPPVDRVGDLNMELDPFEGSQLDLMAGHIAESGTLALMRRLLEPGDTFVDVGAHVGLHSLVAGKAVGPGGRVFAIDPQPYCCDRVLTNAALNGLANVLVIAAAAGDHDGFVTLHSQQRGDHTRLTLTGAGIADLPARFEAPLVRLDTLTERHGIGAIKILKIDVEGYEVSVLAGAARALKVTGNLIFEHLPQAGEAAGRDMAALIGAAGFDLRQIDGTSWVPGQPASENNLWAARKG